MITSGSRTQPSCCWQLSLRQDACCVPEIIKVWMVEEAPAVRLDAFNTTSDFQQVFAQVGLWFGKCDWKSPVIQTDVHKHKPLPSLPIPGHS